ncbi:MAG TPA: hypothetical protein ENG87_04160 [Candidatus Pacearchaeota archaeon]|nr:adenylate kinase [archaeon BMS3Abin17]HDK42548.1 hypothetical protein [Candidatus Pacearchaeota archaeon]HDZ60822.1 hypothetical protein [Candidatus Pacearchaeota archaeon]
MKKIFLGPPGSGKGTAASRIALKLNTPHISTGDLFRKNIKEQTPLGINAQEYLNEDKLVPDEIVIEMLKQRISKEDCKKGFIPFTYWNNLQGKRRGCFLSFRWDYCSLQCNL